MDPFIFPHGPFSKVATMRGVFEKLLEVSQDEEIPDGLAETAEDLVSANVMNHPVRASIDPENGAAVSHLATRSQEKPRNNVRYESLRGPPMSSGRHLEGNVFCRQASLNIASSQHALDNMRVHQR